jgi:hypothetical protein
MIASLKVKIIGITLGLIFGTASLLCFWLVYLAFFDYRVPPITRAYAYPTPVESGAKSRGEIKEVLSVRVGETFYVYREFCVDHPFISTETRRVFVNWTDHNDAYSAVTAPSRAEAMVGCSARTYANSVPLGVPPGKYIFRGHTSYVLSGNPVGSWVYQWDEVDVNVVAAVNAPGAK